MSNMRQVQLNAIITEHNYFGIQLFRNTIGVEHDCVDYCGGNNFGRIEGSLI